MNSQGIERRKNGNEVHKNPDGYGYTVMLAQPDGSLTPSGSNPWDYLYNARAHADETTEES